METIYEMLTHNAEKKDAIVEAILHQHVEYVKDPKTDYEMGIEEEKKLRQLFGDYIDNLLQLQPLDEESVLFCYDDEFFLVEKGDIYCAYVPRYQELENEKLDDEIENDLVNAVASARWYAGGGMERPVRKILNAEVDYSVFNEMNDVEILAHIIHLCAFMSSTEDDNDVTCGYNFDLSDEAEKDRAEMEAFTKMLRKAGRMNWLKDFEKFAEQVMEKKKYYVKKIQLCSEYVERYLLPCRTTFGSLLERYTDEAIIRKMKELKTEYPNFGDLHFRSVEGLKSSLNKIRNTEGTPKSLFVIFASNAMPEHDEPISLVAFPYYGIQDMKNDNKLYAPMPLGGLQYKNLLAAEVHPDIPSNQYLTMIACIIILASMSGDEADEKRSWMDTIKKIEDDCVQGFRDNCKTNQKLDFEERTALCYEIERSRNGYSIQVEKEPFINFNSQEELREYQEKNNFIWFAHGSKAGFCEKDDTEGRKIMQAIMNFKF